MEMFKMEFDSDYHPITDKILKKFIKQYKLKKFPEMYSNFLKSYNGGTTSHDEFKVSCCDVLENSILSFFYGIDPDNLKSDKFDTLSYALKTFQGSIPENTLPIATDDYGNIICLVLAGKKKNQIFIWVHDFPAEERSWENMFFVADDFLALIESLEQSDSFQVEIDAEKDLCRRGDLSGLTKILETKPKDKRVTQLAESCAAFGQIELLKHISKQGYLINDVGITWQAFAGRRTAVILYLLKNHSDINHKLEDDSTWLHVAAEYNLPEVAEYLIDNGCPVLHKNEQGYTAYTEAMFYKSHEVTELLKKYM